MIFASGSSATAITLALSLFIGVSGVATAQQPSVVRTNLLTTGNFEKGVQGWEVHPFSKNGTATPDEVEKRDGKSTLKATNSPSDDLMVTQKITVKPMTRYRVTGYIKAKDVASDQKGDKTGACIAIKGGFEHSQMIQGTRPWTKVSWDFDNGKSTEIEMGPRLGHYAKKVSGTAWFADLSVVEIGKARK